MNLVIQILTAGTLFHIREVKDASVTDLKKEISNQEKLSENRLILMLDTGHRDSIMLNNDEIFLVDYEVTDGSHFYLFFQLSDNNDNGNNDDGENMSIVNAKTLISEEDFVTSTTKVVKSI